MNLSILAILTLIMILAFSAEMAWGALRMKSLGTISPEVSEPEPAVSIIFSALNEEETIVKALQSLVKLDYNNLEIIAVNDRSTDTTGKLLEQQAALSSKIKVLHIDALPAGWLGKNHALHFGAQHARGDFLLFTDADVSLEATTLKRAIRHMQDKKIDHLSLFFSAQITGGLLNMVVVELGVNIAALLKPWKASDPKSSHAIGIGAFNLVTREAYNEIGGHTKIAMSPIDDVMLGVLLKKHGFQLECLQGGQFVKVPWYTSLSAMLNGLEKNSYAALDYNLWKVVGVSIVMLAAGIWPYWALIFTSGTTRLLNAAIVGCYFLLFGAAIHFAGLPKKILFWLPISTHIRLYTLWRAVCATIHQGGINWRGTFYPLAELKAHHIPMQGVRHDKRNSK